MVIFSGQAEGPKPNANTVCSLARENAGDTRVINPESTEITVRFTGDFGAAYPEITATVNGLGFSNRTVTLTREALPLGGFAYDSADLALDPEREGCIRAALTAAFGGAAAGSTAFHTVGATC
jgi:hypothetical protein